MTVMDNARYVNGRRIDAPVDLNSAYGARRERGGLAWVDLYRPDPKEIESVAEKFTLPELAVKETLHGHPRSKLERYGDILFAVLRPARYLDAAAQVEFDELHVFVGSDFVVTVRDTAAPSLRSVRQRLETTPELLALGPQMVLCAILGHVVENYESVVAGVENDIDEIEDQLFTDAAEVARRIYELSREVIGFQRATHPLGAMVEALRREAEEHDAGQELQIRLRHIHPQVDRVVERVDAFLSLLHNALGAHATLVGQRQNEEMRRLTEASLAQNEDVKRSPPGRPSSSPPPWSAPCTG